MKHIVHQSVATITCSGWRHGRACESSVTVRLSEAEPSEDLDASALIEANECGWRDGQCPDCSAESERDARQCDAGDSARMEAAVA